MDKWAYQERVDEELDEEEISKVCLIRGREADKETGRAAVEDSTQTGSSNLLLELCDLRVQLAEQDQRGHEGTEDLSEDVEGGFLDGETFEDGEGDGDGLDQSERKLSCCCGENKTYRVEVTTGSGSGGDDGERDTQSICPADLEDRRELRLHAVEVEARSGCDTGIYYPQKSVRSVAVTGRGKVYVPYMNTPVASAAISRRSLGRACSKAKRFSVMGRRSMT